MLAHLSRAQAVAVSAIADAKAARSEIVAVRDAQISALNSLRYYTTLFIACISSILGAPLPIVRYACTRPDLLLFRV
jgi:VIT1/CCC1 family predicted Fe2+/Mn2+ transporter